MLKYLILITEELIVAGILAGALSAFITAVFGKKGRNTMLIGAGAAVAVSVVIAIVKNTVRKFETGKWNLGIFIATIAVSLLFIIFASRDVGKKRGKAWGRLTLCFAGALMFLVLLYELPDVLAYPWNFDVADNTVLSTDFIYRFIGYLLGILLCFIAGVATYQMIHKLSAGNAMHVLRAVFIVNIVNVLLKALQIMYTNRMIPSNKTLFQMLKFTSNHSNAFLYLIMAAAGITAVCLFIENLTVREEYSNSAELRKIRARMRRMRRWAAALVICCVLAVLNMTVIKAVINKEVELAPAEEVTVDGDSVFVTFAQVEDGHLHRFAYTTDDGVTVRFIVIKKPNSSAYGIGLDACDICGETGYYERDGQVVCKLCDVVMNINTIGFKGGCNPIVIAYSIGDGRITVPISELVAHQDEFK